MSPLEELNEAYGEVFEMLTVHGCHDSVIPLVYLVILEGCLCFIVILPVVKPFAAYAMSLVIREMGFVEVAG